jgi:hypothetical protein
LANLTITVPDALVPRITEAFKAQYDYKATLPDGTANPETEALFMKRMILEYVKQITVAHEAVGAAETARTNATNKTKNDFA